MVSGYVLNILGYTKKPAAIALRRVYMYDVKLNHRVQVKNHGVIFCEFLSKIYFLVDLLF